MESFLPRRFGGIVMLAQEGARALYLKRLHAKALTLCAAVLCVTSQIKFAEIQLLEIIFAVDVLIVLVWGLISLRPLILFRPFVRIGMHWALFSVGALLLSLLALRQDFYADSVSLLKQPFLATVSRIGELFLDVYAMLFLAEAYRDDLELCRFAVWIYYLVGVAGALFSVVSAALFPLQIGLLSGAYGIGARMRGFNNEGGSYGTYLLTVIFLTMVMRQRRWLGFKTYLLSMLLFTFVLLGSQSKAAFFEVALFVLIGPVLRLRGWKMASALVLATATLTIAYTVIDVPRVLDEYLSAGQQYEELSPVMPDNYNVVAGRTSGVYLAPKMIKAHPLAGIGLGNYPIVRNAPEYRKGTPIVRLPLDSPSLGPIDYLVDLGFPLFLYFTFVEVYPALALIRRRAGFALTSVVLMQPVANWFGAHLNLTYPWVAAAIALGLTYGPDGPLSRSEAASTEAPLMSLQGAAV